MLSIPGFFSDSFSGAAAYLDCAESMLDKLTWIECNDNWQRQRKVPEKNPSQCHFHQQPLRTCYGISTPSCLTGGNKVKFRPRIGRESPEGKLTYRVIVNLSPRWVWMINAMPWPRYRRERPGTHCIGGWVVPRGGLDGVRKIPSTSGFDSWSVQPVASRYPGLFVFVNYNLNSKSTWYNVFEEGSSRYPSLSRNRNNIHKNRAFFFNLVISVAQLSKNVFTSCGESTPVLCLMESYVKLSYILISGVCQIRFNNNLSCRIQNQL
jgi:hypothetical protein